MVTLEIYLLCRMARQGFILPKDLYSRSCSPVFEWSPDLLNIKCPLFARKFGNDTAAPLLQKIRRCGDNKLFITAPVCK